MKAQQIPTIDFETTDKDAKTCKAVEVAILGPGSEVREELIDPGIPIPPETSAIHHICDADVVGKRKWPEVKASIREFLESLPRKILCAHNAEYEQGVLGPDFADVEWICTYKCALRAWPDLPTYKNEGIRYHFKFEGIGRSGGTHQAAHSALHDCRVTAEILQRLLQDHDVETLIAWSKSPKQLPTMPFGKHAGSKWHMIPGDYLAWIVRQGPDFDADIKYLAREELTRRKNATPRPG